MRALGFVGPKGPVLTFCVAAYVASEAALERSLYAFGAVDEPGRIARDWLGEDDTFQENVDAETILVKATGVRVQPAKGRASVATVTPPRLEVRLGAKTYTVDVASSGLKPAVLPKLSPSEVMAIALARVAREDLLLSVDDVAKRLALPNEPRFVLDDWQHPSAVDEKASASPDVVDMCEALESGAPLRLQGKANGSPASWVAELIALRTEKDLGWGGTWTPGSELSTGKKPAKKP